MYVTISFAFVVSFHCKLLSCLHCIFHMAVVRKYLCILYWRTQISHTQPACRFQCTAKTRTLLSELGKCSVSTSNLVSMLVYSRQLMNISTKQVTHRSFSRSIL